MVIQPAQKRSFGRTIAKLEDKPSQFLSKAKPTRGRVIQSVQQRTADTLKARSLIKQREKEYVTLQQQKLKRIQARNEADALAGFQRALKSRPKTSSYDERIAGINEWISTNQPILTNPALKERVRKLISSEKKRLSGLSKNEYERAISELPLISAPIPGDTMITLEFGDESSPEASKQFIQQSTALNEWIEKHKAVLQRPQHFTRAQSQIQSQREKLKGNIKSVYDHLITELKSKSGVEVQQTDDTTIYRFNQKTNPDLNSKFYGREVHVKDGNVVRDLQRAPSAKSFEGDKRFLYDVTVKDFSNNELISQGSEQSFLNSQVPDYQTYLDNPNYKKEYHPNGKLKRIYKTREYEKQYSWRDGRPSRSTKANMLEHEFVFDNKGYLDDERVWSVYTSKDKENKSGSAGTTTYGTYLSSEKKYDDYGMLTESKIGATDSRDITRGEIGVPYIKQELKYSLGEEFFNKTTDYQDGKRFSVKTLDKPHGIDKTEFYNKSYHGTTTSDTTKNIIGYNTWGPVYGVGDVKGGGKDYETVAEYNKRIKETTPEKKGEELYSGIIGQTKYGDIHALNSRIHSTTDPDLITYDHTPSYLGRAAEVKKIDQIAAWTMLSDTEKLGLVSKAQTVSGTGISFKSTGLAGGVFGLGPEDVVGIKTKETTVADLSRKRGGYGKTQQFREPGLFSDMVTQTSASGRILTERKARKQRLSQLGEKAVSAWQGLTTPQIMAEIRGGKEISLQDFASTGRQVTGLSDISSTIRESREKEKAFYDGISPITVSPQVESYIQQKKTSPVAKFEIIPSVEGYFGEDVTKKQATDAFQRLDINRVREPALDYVQGILIESGLRKKGAKKTPYYNFGAISDTKTGYAKLYKNEDSRNKDIRRMLNSLDANKGPMTRVEIADATSIKDFNQRQADSIMIHYTLQTSGKKINKWQTQAQEYTDKLEGIQKDLKQKEKHLSRMEGLYTTATIKQRQETKTINGEERIYTYHERDKNLENEYKKAYADYWRTSKKYDIELQRVQPFFEKYQTEANLYHSAYQGVEKKNANIITLSNKIQSLSRTMDNYTVNVREKGLTAGESITGAIGFVKESGKAKKQLSDLTDPFNVRTTLSQKQDMLSGRTDFPYLKDVHMIGKGTQKDLWQRSKQENSMVGNLGLKVATGVSAGIEFTSKIGEGLLVSGEYVSKKLKEATEGAHRSRKQYLAKQDLKRISGSDKEFQKLMVNQIKKNVDVDLYYGGGELTQRGFYTSLKYPKDDPKLKKYEKSISQLGTVESLFKGGKEYIRKHPATTVEKSIILGATTGTTIFGSPFAGIGVGLAFANLPGSAQTASAASMDISYGLMAGGRSLVEASIPTAEKIRKKTAKKTTTVKKYVDDYGQNVVDTKTTSSYRPLTKEQIEKAGSVGAYVAELGSLFVPGRVQLSLLKTGSIKEIKSRPTQFASDIALGAGFTVLTSKVAQVGWKALASPTIVKSLEKAPKLTTAAIKIARVGGKLTQVGLISAAIVPEAFQVYATPSRKDAEKRILESSRRMSWIVTGSIGAARLPKVKAWQTSAEKYKGIYEYAPDAAGVFKERSLTVKQFGRKQELFSDSETYFGISPKLFSKASPLAKKILTKPKFVRTVDIPKSYAELQKVYVSEGWLAPKPKASLKTSYYSAKESLRKLTMSPVKKAAIQFAKQYPTEVYIKGSEVGARTIKGFRGTRKSDIDIEFFPGVSKVRRTFLTKELRVNMLNVKQKVSYEVGKGTTQRLFIKDVKGKDIVSLSKSSFKNLAKGDIVQVKDTGFLRSSTSKSTGQDLISYVGKKPAPGLFTEKAVFRYGKGHTRTFSMVSKKKFIADKYSIIKALGKERTSLGFLGESGASKTTTLVTGKQSVSGYKDSVWNIQQVFAKKYGGFGKSIFGLDKVSIKTKGKVTKFDPWGAQKQAKYNKALKDIKSYESELGKESFGLTKKGWEKAYQRTQDFWTWTKATEWKAGTPGLKPKYKIDFQEIESFANRPKIASLVEKGILKFRATLGGSSTNLAYFSPKTRTKLGIKNPKDADIYTNSYKQLSRYYDSGLKKLGWKQVSPETRLKGKQYSVKVEDGSTIFKIPDGGKFEIHKFSSFKKDVTLLSNLYSVAGPQQSLFGYQLGKFIPGGKFVHKSPGGIKVADLKLQQRRLAVGAYSDIRASKDLPRLIQSTRGTFIEAFAQKPLRGKVPRRFDIGKSIQSVTKLGKQTGHSFKEASLDYLNKIINTRKIGTSLWKSKSTTPRKFKKTSFELDTTKIDKPKAPIMTREMYRKQFEALNQQMLPRTKDTIRFNLKQRQQLSKLEEIMGPIKKKLTYTDVKKLGLDVRADLKQPKQLSPPGFFSKLGQTTQKMFGSKRAGFRPHSTVKEILKTSKKVKPRPIKKLVTSKYPKYKPFTGFKFMKSGGEVYYPGKQRYFMIPPYSKYGYDSYKLVDYKSYATPKPYPKYKLLDYAPYNTYETSIASTGVYGDSAGSTGSGGSSGGYTPYKPYTPYVPYTPYTPYTPYKPYTPYVPYSPYLPYTPYIPKKPIVSGFMFKRKAKQKPREKADPLFAYDLRKYKILDLSFGKRKSLMAL